MLWLRVHGVRHLLLSWGLNLWELWLSEFGRRQHEDARHSLSGKQAGGFFCLIYFMERNVPLLLLPHPVHSPFVIIHSVIIIVIITQCFIVQGQTALVQHFSQK